MEQLSGHVAVTKVTFGGTRRSPSQVRICSKSFSRARSEKATKGISLWTTFRSKMEDVPPKLCARLKIQACADGRTSLAITLIGREKVERLVASELDLLVITLTEPTKVREERSKRGMRDNKISRGKFVLPLRRTGLPRSVGGNKTLLLVLRAVYRCDFVPCN